MTPQIHIEPYVEARHYAVVAEWWERHGQEPDAPEMLPGDTRPGAGFLARAGDAGWYLAAAWIYETGTGRWFGPHSLTVNPLLHEADGGRAVANLALDAVMDACEAHMAAQGGGYLETVTPEFTAASRGRKHGMIAIGKPYWLAKRVAALPDGAGGA